MDESARQVEATAINWQKKNQTVWTRYGAFLPMIKDKSSLSIYWMFCVIPFIYSRVWNNFVVAALVILKRPVLMNQCEVCTQLHDIDAPFFQKYIFVTLNTFTFLFHHQIFMNELKKLYFITSSWKRCRFNFSVEYK